MQERKTLMSNLDIINCNYNDPYVWDMIGDGRVKGCFQIESFLGKDWCKKLKPRNINELADLISLIRPGCLSMAQIYCDRRSKKAEIVSLHPLIDDILKDTFGIIVYQEQSMMIAQKLAGFTLEQADDLRKAIGKKKADLMKKVRTQFIVGCIANNVPESKAIEIFDIIELSNRYSFNKSHAVCYAYNSYWSAYLKYHRPRKFLTNWLKLACEKVDPDAEVKENVMSAKSDGIDVFGPHYKSLSDDFFWDSQNKGVRFGICNIKHVGMVHYEQVKNIISELKDPTWTELCLSLLDVNKRSIENMISVGVFSGLKKTRTEMLHEHSCLLNLTENEILALRTILDRNAPIVENLRAFVSKGTKKDGGLISTKGRLSKIEDIITRMLNPGRCLKDNPSVYSRLESDLLGCSIYHSELSSSADAVYANTTCSEIADGKLSKSTLAAIIKRIRVHRTKKGDDMCFLTIEDNSGELENVVIFTELYGQNKDIIYQDSTVLITGEIKDKERRSFIVESIFQI